MSSSQGVRRFETGATRDVDDDKLDFEGFLSPLVVEAYGRYMHRHRQQADGAMRASDNWQRGMPADAYMKSAWRHFLAWWQHHRSLPASETLEDALCAVIFNASGYLHERLKTRLVTASRGVCADPACGCRVLRISHAPSGQAPIPDATGC